MSVVCFCKDVAVNSNPGREINVFRQKKKVTKKKMTGWIVTLQSGCRRAFGVQQTRKKKKGS